METYRERLRYGEMAKDAVEIGGGFIASGFTGRYVENAIKPGVSSASSSTDKILAGLANNVPKVALYYIFNSIKLRGAAAATMGSVGFDVLVRATNNGINPASVYVDKYRVLDNQNQNIQPSQNVLPIQDMQPYMDWAERQREFGAMPASSSSLARRRRFRSIDQMGFMPDPKDSELNAMFGMK